MERNELSGIEALVIATTFDKLVCHEGAAFDAWGQACPVRIHAPLFYTMERGPSSGSLDCMLHEQSLELSAGEL